MSSDGPLKLGNPREVDDLYAGVSRVLDMACTNGLRAGNCKHGVYLFRDYDGEPIYVGQTKESLRTRIRRHLTNQRTDAVAMHVLDPFEVDEIVIWPFWDLAQKSAAEATLILDRAEFTVYNQALRDSEFGVVLNEKPVVADSEIELPELVRGRILSDEVREARNHPDVRLARRARTLANLAAVISERSVQTGIRHTLLAQAQRLESLARTRLQTLDAPPGGGSPAGDCASLEEAKSMLGRYSEALMAAAEASSGDVRDEAERDLVEIIQQMQVNGEGIARVLRDWLAQETGQSD